MTADEDQHRNDPEAEALRLSTLNTGANPGLKSEVASVLFDAMVGRLLIFPPCYTLQIGSEGLSFSVDEKSENCSRPGFALPTG